MASSHQWMTDINPVFFTSLPTGPLGKKNSEAKGG